MLTDDRDLALLRSGFRHLLTVIRHPALQAVAAEIVLDGEGTGLGALAADEELDAWLVTHTGSYVHASGTCRMGAASDASAVVDPRGRVIGWSGLRVADASIMPELPRANPHLTSVMIGERIAAAIRSGGDGRRRARSGPTWRST